MRFEEVIENLRVGNCIFRDNKNWIRKYQFIFRPKPNMKISKFNSSDDFKTLTEGIDNIILKDQILALEFDNGLAAYQISVEDLFAEDWNVIRINRQEEQEDVDSKGSDLDIDAIYDELWKDECFKKKLLQLFMTK